MTRAVQLVVVTSALLAWCGCALLGLYGPYGEVCGDGVDNDGDGLTDCADIECVCTEECDNGADDDGDGDIDCEDADCEEACTEANCVDGLDDNGNGDVDCEDEDCWDEPECDTDLDTGD